jgi:hypothetical protein
VQFQVMVNKLIMFCHKWALHICAQQLFNKKKVTRKISGYCYLCSFYSPIEIYTLDEEIWALLVLGSKQKAKNWKLYIFCARPILSFNRFKPWLGKNAAQETFYFWSFWMQKGLKSYHRIIKSKKNCFDSKFIKKYINEGKLTY